MIVKWLDFSDLHFEYTNVDTVNIRDNLLSTISDKELDADFILMCGDFFYQGKTDESRIKACGDYIHKIISSAGCDKSSVYMTPGNHDLVRSNERNHLLSYYTNINYETGKKKTEVEHELDANAFKNLNNGSPDSFLGYAKLYKKITGKVFKGNHECIEKDSYRILNINTSILAGSAYDEGNLSVYCGPLLEECKKIKNDDKINIAFMHHGVEFLKKTERRKFEQLMESHYIDIVFSGHSHDIGIRTYDHTGNRMRQFTCGGPLKDGYNKPSFYYCIYDSDTHELKCYLYTYNDEIQDWNLANTERAFKDGKCSFILPRFQKKSKYFDTTRDRELDGRKNLQDDYLKQFGIVAALPLKEFIRKRNVMIQNAKGNIILAGQSLENAFDIREDNESIVNSIKHNKNIKNIDIFLTDPIMFDSATEVEVGDTPISRIGTTMHTILYDIYKELEKDQSINIYFIPLVQLDHMVFVDDLLLLRHTLLWTNDSHYKATPLICKRIDKNSTLDRIIVNSAMYNVYAEYINRLKTDSMVIEIKQYGNSAKNETKAKKSHREWRERLYYLRKSKKLKGQIIMHKLYRSQLISDLHSTWDPRFRSFSAEINWGDEGESGFFNPDKLDGKIDSPDKLYDASNLLNDDTQKILLPYIKETEHLLNGMVKRYDKCGEAHIFPSLDVGFPNNILRLAGGFATGMLVVWKSGTPLVPVDTIVNVCSSSYYEFDESALKGRKVSDFFNQKIIQNIINKGSVKEGLAFSFNTGNHFILLSKSRNTGHYFLVLHSSAKQYKDTYLGLYPKPHNWYSNLIKTYQEKGSDRYIHYLKDDEALRFISIARSLNEQNRDIHNWFASEIFGDIKPIQQKTYHHYGMPTDYSIAIGTYVVDERDVVPIFSREGYPIFLFRPSSNMWSIVLEGKTKYIIPHGWGQELRYDYFAKQIQKEDFKNGKLSIKNGKFVLSNSQHGYYEKKFDIDYSARFNKKQVGVRDLYKTDKFDGKNIFGDTPYIKGTIEEILDPVALFSSDTEGAVKYYVSGEEN